MEYGKKIKFNNFMQSFKRPALALMMFAPLVLIFVPVVIIITQNVSNLPLFAYPLMALACFTVIWALYISDTILRLRNKFEKQIGDLNLESPDQFDLESLRSWWQKAEPVLASRITQLTERTQHSYKVAKNLQTLPDGSTIAPRDLQMIANLGENATLLVQYYKFYNQMEAMCQGAMVLNPCIPAN